MIKMDREKTIEKKQSDNISSAVQERRYRINEKVRKKKNALVCE